MIKNVASAVAAGLAMTLLVPGAVAAAEDGQVIAGTASDKTSNDNIENRPISLTVKKTGHNPYDDAPGDQAAGVKFHLRQVDGVDVTDDAVRQEVLDKYSYPYIKEHGLTMTHVQSGVTDEQGFVSFTGLKPGLYVLEQEGSNDNPYVIMLPMISGDGLHFEYDNLIVTKNFPETPTTPPETSTPPKAPPSVPPTSPSTSTSTSTKTTATTPTSTPPKTTPPAKTTPPKGGTPIYPGGPKVSTGGFAIPSPTGDGNMSLLTMMALLAFIVAAGYGVIRVVATRAAARHDD